MAIGPSETAPSMPAALVALCRPVDPELVVSLIEQAGFSGEAYLAEHEKVRTLFSTPRRACVHFLLYGFAERRRFLIALNPEPLERLRDLPIANRGFVANLIAALGGQFVGQANVDRDIDAKWPVIAHLRRLGAAPFLLIGSSDARNYGITGVRGERWLLPLRLVENAKAAMSLTDGDDFAARIKRFVRHMERLSDGAPLPILIKFGQVDVEFAFNLSRVRDDELAFDRQRFDAFCARSIARYAAFLDDLVPDTHRSPITVASIFPSSVSDAGWADGFLLRHADGLRGRLDDAEIDRRCRALEIPDQAERTTMNRHYNDLLRGRVQAMGYRFLNDFDTLLGPYGVIDDAYTRVGKGHDCHIDALSPTRELSLLLWGIIDDAQGQGALLPAPPPKASLWNPPMVWETKGE